MLDGIVFAHAVTVDKRERMALGVVPDVATLSLDVNDGLSCAASGHLMNESRDEREGTVTTWWDPDWSEHVATDAMAALARHDRSPSSVVTLRSIRATAHMTFSPSPDPYDATRAPWGGSLPLPARYQPVSPPRRPYLNSAARTRRAAQAAQQRGGRTVRVPRDRAERSTGSASERAHVDMSDSYLTGITIIDVSREPRKVTGHSQCFDPDGKVGFFQERCLS